MPSISRTSDPVRIGVPISRPNWVSLRPSSALISIPMIAKIVHTAKQIVKAKVLSPSARPCSPCVAVTPGPMCNSHADHHRGSTAVHHHVQLLRSRLEIPACWLRSEEHTSELQSLMRTSYA